MSSKEPKQALKHEAYGSPVPPKCLSNVRKKITPVDSSSYSLLVWVSYSAKQVVHFVLKPFIAEAC